MQTLTRWSRHLGYLLILGFVGCSNSPVPSEVSDALENADKFELLSINPDDGADATGQELFQGWIKLGSTQIEDQQTRSKIATVLKNGICESTPVPACFNPRHGLRLTQGNQVIDVLICFECSQIYWFIDSEPQDTILTLSSAQPTFNEILLKHNVPLPEPFPKPQDENSETVEESRNE